MAVQERYNALVLGVNGTANVTSTGVAGFLCVTAGTLTLTRTNDVGTVITIVSALPVSAGVYVPIPFLIGSKGGTVTLAGGASGALAVS